jgi:hypothetical protein
MTARNTVSDIDPPRQQRTFFTVATVRAARGARPHMSGGLQVTAVHDVSEACEGDLTDGHPKPKAIDMR